MYINAFKFSSAGGRSYNEDSAEYHIEGENGIFVVADGLGGHSHGELASGIVCDTFMENWKPFEQERAGWISSTANIANERILAMQQEKNARMKSTLTALAIDGNKAVWAHSGDSRIYYIHNGWIEAVTEDHSVAYKKFKAGEISRNEISYDDDQSSLLRSLGGDTRFEPEVRVWDANLVSGDGFLLCSDGAWEYLRDGEIPIDMLKSHDAQEWAQLLVLRMMDRIVRDNDNLTVLTVMLR